ncbi:MAG: hypothetical protein J1E98_00660 [Lachnospiraceae bacterium]|nr:hypothetical protein [Lachnospiraceae bacterium]
MKMQKGKVMLGTSANLILGFDPAWQLGETGNNGLFLGADKPLEEIQIDVPVPGETDYEWSCPKITVHDDAESLLQEIFPYKISSPSDGTEMLDVNLGVMLIGDQDREMAVKKLSGTLGVDLSKPYGYVLVRIERISGEVKHPVYGGDIILHPNPKHKNEEMGICENFRSDLIKIRKATDKENDFNPALFTVEKARKCLEFYDTYGTHFVSQAVCGDAIFQVFAYEKMNYERVKNIYEKNDFTEEKALNFLPYITDANTGAFGYVKEYGKILCYSGDPQLVQDQKNGKWWDEKWSERDCIFTPFFWNGPMKISELNRNYSKNLPLYYTLTSLFIFAEYGRRLALKRVFKGAMVQKFGTAVKPYFSKYFPYNKSDLPAYHDIMGFVSTIATRTINTYKPNLNIDELQFVASSDSNSFTLVSNLVSASSSRHSFPGKDAVFVFQNADFESDDFVTVIELGEEAYKNCVISCKEFYGCLQILSGNSGKHITIVDGICYTTDSKKNVVRQMVTAVRDIRHKYDTFDLLRVKNSIIYSYTFANSVMSSISLGNCISSSCRFAQETMAWLGEMIPEGCMDPELLDIRVLALDNIRMYQSSNHISYVPILPPEKYSKQCKNILNYIDEIQRQIDYYQQKIEQRKTQELIIDVGKALDKNIIESGKLLSRLIQANARQQQELTQYYDSIISVKKSELVQLNQKTDSLEIELSGQKAQVENAVIAYKEAVEIWKTNAEIKFGLDMATTLFTAVTSIAIPASSVEAVKDLGLLVQRIQKLLNITNNVYEVYTLTEQSVPALKNAEEALCDLDDCDFDVTNSSAWNECSIQLNYLLNMGPDIEEKRTLLKEFSLLMLKGKNYMSAKSSAVQLSRDIYNQQRMKVHSKNQQERLDALSYDLEPANLPSLDPLSVDLVGLTGDLMFIQSQMFAMLAKTFLVYDQSLQYRNLQPATEITSFDLMSFKGAIVRQNSNTIEAETKLAAVQVSTTKGIDLKVSVPVSQLTNGNTYVLTVMLDNLNFSKYVDVRIKSVVARIDGISGTDDHKYFVRLNYPGNTFCNKDLNNNVRMFCTNARERIYEYNADTGQPNFTDGGESWSENVSAVTPFSEWEISLPKKLNQGLKFSGVMAEVTLTFVLDTRIVNEANLRQRCNSGKLSTIDELVKEMKEGNALNDWDVVFNLSLEKINEVLEKQHKALTKDTLYCAHIKFNTDYVVSSRTIGMKKIEFDYTYPKISFLANDPTRVQMVIPISSGTVQTGEKNSITNEEFWDDPEPVGDDAYILADLPISRVEGAVKASNPEHKNILSIVLNLAEGTFDPKNMRVEGGADKAAFNRGLEEYFTTKPVIFVINSLNMENMSVLDDLKPNEFVFKTLITKNDTEILQIFIMTKNRKKLNYSLAHLNSVSEPIPDGSKCSLFISSKLFFKDIMPQSIKKNGWKLEGIQPKDNTSLVNWIGKVSQGSFIATVDLSKMNRIDNRTPSVTYDYKYYIRGGSVILPVTDMKLEPNGNAIKASFSALQNQEYIENCITTSYGYFIGESESTLRSEYNLTINANIPLKISGKGRNQKISMSMTDRDCQITGHMSGGGPCGCGVDIQAEFNKRLKEQVPEQIKANMNMDFDAISLFAIKNLLFVDDDYITFSNVAIPGDVIITGTFNNE